MWKAIFQNKLTIYKTNLRQKNYKKSPLCGLISQTSAQMPPKNGGVRKATDWPLAVSQLVKFCQSAAPESQVWLLPPTVNV
jgi:hypothetical protein